MLSSPGVAKRVAANLMKMMVFGLLVAAVAVVAPARAQQRSPPPPTWTELQVNTFTPGDQSVPAVAPLAGGAAIVTWTSVGSPGTDSSLESVQAQIVDATGSLVGGQIQVNTLTAGEQQHVAVDVGGGTIVVAFTSATSAGSDSSLWSVQVRRFMADGTPLDVEAQVNTFTSGIQEQPVVAVAGDGSFVVVWQSEGSSGTDTFGTSIQAQRYDSAGDPVGGEIQVNTVVADDQFSPDVAFDSGGGFAVTWFSTSGDGSGRAVKGQRFDSAGAFVGTEFLVNTYTTGHQYGSRVARDVDDELVIVWSSEGSNGPDDSYSIQGQRFDNTSGSLGAEAELNTFTAGNQIRPAVVQDPSRGGFFIAWASGDFVNPGPDGDDQSIAARRFDENLSQRTAEFLVNTFSAGPQSAPDVAVASDGALLVVWQSEGSAGTDGSGTSIQMQRFVPVPGIFDDGFETGDTSGWSSVVP